MSRLTVDTARLPVLLNELRLPTFARLWPGLADLQKTKLVADGIDRQQARQHYRGGEGRRHGQRHQRYAEAAGGAAEAGLGHAEQQGGGNREEPEAEGQGGGVVAWENKPRDTKCGAAGAAGPVMQVRTSRGAAGR